MTYVKDSPLGSDAIASVDNRIRENQNALQPAFDEEHQFVDADGDANQQSGRHKFYLGTDPESDIGNPVDGSIALDSSPRTNAALAYYDETAGEWFYCEPGDLEYQRRDELGLWTKPQISVWDTVAPGANQLIIDMSLSPTKYATIASNTEIQIPINGAIGTCQNMILELTMSGGPHVITWATGLTNYQTPYGAEPVYANGSGDVNVFFITHLQSGDWLVTSSPGLANL